MSRSTVIIDSRDGSQVVVPVDPQINNNQGAMFYLRKRHAVSGKPLFYSPQQWASFDADTRAKAGDHANPGVGIKQMKEADSLVENYANANPATRAAFLEMLRADLGVAPASKPEPSPAHSGERGGKSR